MDRRRLLRYQPFQVEQNGHRKRFDRRRSAFGLRQLVGCTRVRRNISIRMRRGCLIPCLGGLLLLLRPFALALLEVVVHVRHSDSCLY